MGNTKKTPEKITPNKATRWLFEQIFGENTQEAVQELLEQEGSFSKDPAVDTLLQNMKQAARKTFTS